MWVCNILPALYLEFSLRKALDCEGLRGDSNPIANQVDTRIRKAKAGKLRKPVPTRSSATEQHQSGPPVQPDLAHWLPNKPLPVSKMSLPWAERASKPWRAVVSEKIYPRFLYIFSDIVCYVSGNSRCLSTDLSLELLFG